MSFLLSKEKAERRLTEILRAEGHPLNTRCGEKNMCAGCVIELLQGRLDPVGDGGPLVAAGHPVSFRACQYRPGGGEALRIAVANRALLAYAPQVVGDYKINVPYAHDPIVEGEIGIAIDIGTTTVVVQVVNLRSGQVLGRGSGFNKQMHFGDDVLTRINLCATDSKMLWLLHEAVIQETLRPLIEEALRISGHPIAEVRAYTVAGNTTMLHLFVGEDPSSMGFAPFTPEFLEKAPFGAGAVGLEPECALVHLLPSAAAYIGADLMAGVFATGLLYAEGPCLLVDVGTNGEIILHYDGTLVGCATAAGPAFEGSGLSCGLRAGEGAISHIQLGGDPLEVKYERIGPPGLRPTGICGSTYIDFLAEARRIGMLSHAGRIKRDFPGIAELLESDDYGVAFRVAKGQGSRPIVVTEADIGKLLQAKAAVAAGIVTLLRRFDMEPKDVPTLFLAGGFGMHLNLENAIRCGLLPGFRVEQIQLVGNTSLGGATLCLLDKNLLPEISREREGFEAVELNLEPGFEDTYVDQLALA